MFAHVPNINDFTRGVYEMLEDEGVFTIEFQHLLNILKILNLIIYHEHYSYLQLFFYKIYLEDLTKNLENREIKNSRWKLEGIHQ